VRDDEPLAALQLKDLQLCLSFFECDMSLAMLLMQLFPAGKRSCLHSIKEVHTARPAHRQKEKPAPTAEAEPTSDPPATNTLLDSSSEDVTEEQIEAEWNRLEKRLGSMRLAQVEMDDDGNCM
jgi:hypothetical protein